MFALSYKRRPEHRADDLELHGVQEGVVAVPDREVEQGGVGGELWVSEGQSHTAGEAHCTVLYCTVLYCTVARVSVTQQGGHLYCTVLYCTLARVRVTQGEEAPVPVYRAGSCTRSSTRT